jgi:hypothetical protein
MTYIVRTLPECPAAQPAKGAGPLSQPGPVAILLPYSIDGKPAELTGRLELNNNVMLMKEPRVKVGAKAHLMTDQALESILETVGGYSMEPGYSGQTRVVGYSIKDVIRRFVDGENGDQLRGYSELKDLYKGRSCDYHDDAIALNGPGLPEVIY